MTHVAARAKCVGTNRTCTLYGISKIESCLYYYSFASSESFFNRVEESENIDQALSESSTRLKKYSELAKLCDVKDDSILENSQHVHLLLVSTVRSFIYEDHYSQIAVNLRS